MKAQEIGEALDRSVGHFKDSLVRHSGASISKEGEHWGVTRVAARAQVVPALAGCQLV